MTIEQTLKSTPYNLRLRALRIALGLTAKDAADKCGISERTLLLTETGQTYPQPLTRKAICRGLDISEKELFGDVSQ